MNKDEYAKLIYDGAIKITSAIAGTTGWKEIIDEEVIKTCKNIAKLAGIEPESKVTKTPEIPTWKTITIGCHRSKQGYLASFGSDIKVSNWANDLLEKMPYETTRRTIDLVKVSVKELEFDDYTTTAQIYAKAKELGLELCSAEVGPALLLEYTDQPYGEWILIGMEPIVDSDGRLNVFSVVHDGYGRRLSTSSGRPGSEWRPEDVWLFSRSKR